MIGKRNKFNFLFFCGIIFSLSFACKKEKAQLPFEALSIESNTPLYGIAYKPDGALFVCGGEAKKNGSIFSSTNWNGLWNKVYGNDTACIYDVFFVNDSVGFACGDKLLILKTTDGGTHWFSCFNWYKPYHRGYHVPLRKMFFVNEKLGYVVGGDEGDKGLVYVTNDGYGDWDFVEIEHELRDVYRSNSGDILVVGNGIVYQCDENLKNGTQHHFSGDFLTSLGTNNNSLFAVGYSGGIYTNNDGSVNWSVAERPSGLFNKRMHNNEILFFAGRWIIFGNNGMVKLSDDGQHWKTYNSCDGADLLNGIFFNEQILIISRNGFIYKLDLKE